MSTQNWNKRLLNALCDDQKKELGLSKDPKEALHRLACMDADDILQLIEYDAEERVEWYKSAIGIRDMEKLRQRVIEDLETLNSPENQGL